MKGCKIVFDPEVPCCVSCRHYLVVGLSNPCGVQGICSRREGSDITFFGGDRCVYWESNPAGFILYQEQ